MGVVGGGGAEVGEGVEVGVGVVAGAGDGAEKEPLAFSKVDECHCPSKSGLGSFGLGGRLLEIARCLAHGLGSAVIRRAFCERAALGFWRARVRGAVLGHASQWADASRLGRGLARQAIIGLRGVFDKRHLRAMSAPRARSTSSGRSGSVPWVPPGRRRRLRARGARRLRRRAGRLT